MPSVRAATTSSRAWAASTRLSRAIRPLRSRRIGEGLTWSKTSYASMYGEIVSDWKKENGKVRLNVTVPPNTHALIRLPAASTAQVTEGGQPLAQSAGLSVSGENNGSVCVRAASGHYAFEF